MTSARSARPTRRVAVCLAVVGLAAATSSPALAEDGVVGIAIPSVSELGNTADAVLADAGLAELDLGAVADPPLALPAVPAQKTAAEPVTEGAGAAAPPPEPVPDAPPVADLPAVAAAAAATAPAVEQTAPANVNVTVRVDSPGDNGAVAQVNAAEAGALPTVPQYQPEPPQYQAPVAAAAAPAADPASPPPTDPATADAPGWDWTWTWNCGDAAPEMSVPPGVEMENWTWNWIWNCDEENPGEKKSDTESSAQYQPVVTQYRPININVSIRINSPGNDGPVVQANVAVAMATPMLVPVAVPPPVAATTQSEPASVEAPEAALVSLLLWFDGGLELGPTPDDLVGCCLTTAPGAAAQAAASSRIVPDAPQPATVAGDLTVPARFRAAVAVTLRLARDAEGTARAARAARAPAPSARPAPPRRLRGPVREPAAVVNAAGMTPLNAPDGRFGYLVLLVAGLVFAIAFADASRSVAAELRAAGEDPDPPPDHPG